MEKRKEIIYSKKAPRIDFEEFSSDVFSQLTEEEQKEINVFVQKAYSKFKATFSEDLIYIKMQSRCIDEFNFITALREYSKNSDVDVEIVREEHDIMAYISFDTTSHLNNLSEILSFADRNRFKLGINDREITLVLTFYTHQRCTKDGICLYPFKTDTPIDINAITF